MAVSISCHLRAATLRTCRKPMTALPTMIYAQRSSCTVGNRATPGLIGSARVQEPVQSSAVVPQQLPMQREYIRSIPHPGIAPS